MTSYVFCIRWSPSGMNSQQHNCGTRWLHHVCHKWSVIMDHCPPTLHHQLCHEISRRPYAGLSHVMLLALSARIHRKVYHTCINGLLSAITHQNFIKAFSPEKAQNNGVTTRRLRIFIYLTNSAQ